MLRKQIVILRVVQGITYQMANLVEIRQYGEELCNQVS